MAEISTTVLPSKPQTSRETVPSSQRRQRVSRFEANIQGIRIRKSADSRSDYRNQIFIRERTAESTRTNTALRKVGGELDQGFIHLCTECVTDFD